MFRTILGLPFAILCYLCMIPGLLFGSIACALRGKDFPGMKSSK